MHILSLHYATRVEDFTLYFVFLLISLLRIFFLVFISIVTFIVQLEITIECVSLRLSLDVGKNNLVLNVTWSYLYFYRSKVYKKLLNTMLSS